MPSAQAKKLCPQLIIVPHNMEKYKEASKVMREVFHRYTDLVEPLSLDEAYLDVTDCEACGGSATRIAEEIRASIYSQLNITVSAGVSNSKFLAKIASDWRKPDGLFVIPPDRVDAFVRDLPVKKIHGVGKVTAEKLHRMGIETCGDLRAYDLVALSKKMGSFGKRLHELVHGIDHRAVKPSRIRKSLSVEHTYAQDLPNGDPCREKVPELLKELERRLGKLGPEYKVTKAFVKVKFSDFTTTTLERVGTEASLGDYLDLMGEALERQQSAIRLLGIGVRFGEIHASNAPKQLELFAG